MIGEHGTHVALALCEKIEIRADTDDLGGIIEDRSEIFDDRWPKSHGALIAPDIRPVGIAHQPVLSGEDPGLHSMRIEHVDRAPSNLR